MCTGKLRVQLTDIDNKTYNEHSHIFYEGNDAKEILRHVTPDWGVWVITEIETEDNKFFEFERQHIIVSLDGIL